MQSLTRFISGSHPLYHQTVKELEPIQVKVQADLAVQELPEVLEVQEEHQDHRRR